MTLEHLEDKFYREALANYTQQDFIDAGFPDPFYSNLKEISYDETTHVEFLSGALGALAVEECVYSFPSTTPESFVALAQVIENVGVSAYLGAAKDIVDKMYLTEAGSILTVEARHNAYLRAALDLLPFAQPFDVPLDYDEVYTIAAAFIVSCPPGNADKPLPDLKAFPTLSLATTGTIQSGDLIFLETPGYVVKPSPGSDQLYGAFITVLGPICKLINLSNISALYSGEDTALRTLTNSPIRRRCYGS